MKQTARYYVLRFFLSWIVKKQGFRYTISRKFRKMGDSYEWYGI